MLFYLVPGGFSYLINQNNSSPNWKKLLGFRNTQENLENALIFLLYVRLLVGWLFAFFHHCAMSFHWLTLKNNNRKN